MPARPAGPDGAPIAIYGHGIIASKETMLAVAARTPTRASPPSASTRPTTGHAGQGGFVLELATPRRFGRLTSMTLQAELDELSLFQAIRQHFGGIDLMPWAFPFGGRPTACPTSIPRGSSTRAPRWAASSARRSSPSAPELDGAFLQVPGSGIVDTIYHSLIWSLFTGVVPSGASPGDTQALVGAVGMLLERSDNTHLLDRIRAAGTPLWVAYAANDGVVPNATTNRMLTLLGLPLDGPTTVPVRRGSPGSPRCPTPAPAPRTSPPVTSPATGRLRCSPTWPSATRCR